MKVQIIKQGIPEEISDKGGAFVTLVNKNTVDLETSIDEARDGLFIIGDKLLLKGQFVGLFKSIQKGLERDGNARQLGDFITVYPVPTGEFDLERGWDPKVNGVRNRVRLLNEMEIDVSGWEFEDVTPGRRPFTLESVKAGAAAGVVQVGEAVEINGRSLPATDAIRVAWELPGTDRRGDVPAAKVVSSVTRANIAADALAELASADLDGKTILFTVRGNAANARISAKLKYAAPVEPRVEKAFVLGDEANAGVVDPAGSNVFTGSGLAFADGDALTWHDVDMPDDRLACTVTSSANDRLVFTMAGGVPSGQPVVFTLKTKGGETTVTAVTR